MTEKNKKCWYNGAKTIKRTSAYRMGKKIWR